MPMYDFYCSSCSCEFEDMVGPDEACPPCPNCGSTDTERLLSLSGQCLPNPCAEEALAGAEAVAAAVCSQKPLVSMIQAVFYGKKAPDVSCPSSWVRTMPHGSCK